MVEMLREVYEFECKKEQRIDFNRLYNPSMSPSELLHLALDLVTFDSQHNCLRVSFTNFKQRVLERRRLETIFMESGGTYIRKTAESASEEYSGFETSIPKTELTKKLIVSTEKDYSDSKIDIKVYLTKLRSLPHLQKIQFEIFSLEEPTLVFKCDYVTQMSQSGQQVFLEKFCLSADNLLLEKLSMSANSEGEKVDRDKPDNRSTGFVLTIGE